MTFMAGSADLIENGQGQPETYNLLLHVFIIQISIWQEVPDTCSEFLTIEIWFHQPEGSEHGNEMSDYWQGSPEDVIQTPEWSKQYQLIDRHLRGDLCGQRAAERVPYNSHARIQTSMLPTGRKDVVQPVSVCLLRQCINLGSESWEQGANE
jgi:hypothetical protein